MSSWSQGPGWWQASDSRWYPPGTYPSAEQETQSAAQALHESPLHPDGGLIGLYPALSQTSSFAEYQQKLNQATATLVPEMRKRNRRLKVILPVICIPVALIILFVAGLTILGAQGLHDAESVSNEFVTDVQTDRSANAYQLTTPAFRDAYSEITIAQYVAKVSPLVQGTVKVTHAEVAKFSGEPEEAAILYSLDTSHGSQWLSVELQKNREWQGLNIRGSDLPNNPLAGSPEIGPPSM